MVGSLLLVEFFQDLVIIRNSLFSSLPSGLLVFLNIQLIFYVWFFKYSVDSLSSQSSISNQSLDFGSLISDGLAFLFDLSSDDESSNVVFLG